MAHSGTTQVLVLGCGTSTGVPVIGCGCAVCISSDPKNKRTRSSVLLSNSLGTSVLIDASPDFRFQALRDAITRLDAVLFTHSHADHVLGIEDLRVLSFAHPTGLPIYAAPETLREIRKIFFYIFTPQVGYKGGKLAQISPHELELGTTLTIGSLSFIPIPLAHGDALVYGYRIGNFLYATDCNRIPEESLPLLQGVQCALVDGLRVTPHPSHFSISEAIATVTSLGIPKTYITHMAHSVDYAEVSRTLPAGIELAYDGLRIEVG